jgi:hypothetical protein
MMFQKAQRERVKLRLALEGPSGSGKTYTSLLIAKGLVPGGKIALIDTENRSASLYADLASFDVSDIAPPFEPEAYVKRIKAAEEHYDVLIIDSASHEWNGQGGCLEIHDKMPGNSYVNWNKVNPRHDAFIQAILQAKCHVICTLRTKEKYALEENARGKQEPKKMGMESIQRQGVNYEFSVVLTMDVSHQATSTKDRTGLFPVDRWITPGEDTGRQLAAWLEQGAAPVPQAQAPATPPTPLNLEAVEWEALECKTLDALKALCASHRSAAEACGQMPGLTALYKKHEARLSAAPTGEKGNGKLTPKQRQAIQSHYSKRGLDREARLADLGSFLKRDVTSTNDLTVEEASAFIDAVKEA